MGRTHKTRAALQECSIPLRLRNTMPRPIAHSAARQENGSVRAAAYRSRSFRRGALGESDPTVQSQLLIVVFVPTASPMQPHAGGRRASRRPAKGAAPAWATGTAVYRSRQGDMERPTSPHKLRVGPLGSFHLGLHSTRITGNPMPAVRHHRASLQHPDAILHHRPRILPFRPPIRPFGVVKHIN